MGANFPKPRQIIEEDSEKVTPEALQALVQDGADLDFCDASGYNAMMYSAMEGRADLVRLLARAGADVDLSNKDNSYTPLMLASVNGEAETIKALVEEGYDNENVNVDAMRALQFCAMSGCVEGMRCLLNVGANINERDSNGLTPLMGAADYLDTAEAMKCAVSWGAQVDQVDVFGRTALMHAAMKGKVEMTRYLVEVGAALDMRDNDGKTAMILAAESRYMKLALVECLVSSGADVNIVTTHCDAHHKGKYSVLTAAVYAQNAKLVELLLQNGAKINAEIHIATSLGDIACVHVLIANGAVPYLHALEQFPQLPQHLSHESAPSPVHFAVFSRKPILLQYFLDILFLNDKDLALLQGDQSLKSVTASGTDEALASILNDLTSTPRSLVFLCLYKVSLAVGFGQQRKEGVQQLKLPSVFQRKLMFEES